MDFRAQNVKMVTGCFPKVQKNGALRIARPLSACYDATERENEENALRRISIMAVHVLDEANRCLSVRKPMCQQGVRSTRRSR